MINFLYQKKYITRVTWRQKTWKLVSCVFGKVFFVIVNNNPKSKNYLRKKTFILSHEQNKQILIPPNFVNGFLCLSNRCVFHYKLSYKENILM